MEYFVQDMMKQNEINDEAKELARQAQHGVMYECVLFYSVNKHLELTKV